MMMKHREDTISFETAVCLREQKHINGDSLMGAPYTDPPRSKHYAAPVVIHKVGARYARITW